MKIDSAGFTELRDAQAFHVAIASLTKALGRQGDALPSLPRKKHWTSCFYTLPLATVICHHPEVRNMGHPRVAR